MFVCVQVHVCAWIGRLEVNPRCRSSRATCPVGLNYFIILLIYFIILLIKLLIYYLDYFILLLICMCAYLCVGVCT